MAHTSPHIHHSNTPLWIRSRLPTRTPSIALTLILRILEYPLSLVYELIQATQKSFSADTAIRIDDVNPAGVYFFTHALATTKAARALILSHTDLACNTSYHFAASRTVFPRVSPYQARDRLRLLAHVYDSVASIHMTENPGRHG